MTVTQYFLFDYDARSGARVYSWVYVDDEFAGRAFGRWHGSEGEAIAEARSFQRALCQVQIPRQPEFHPTDPLKRR